MGHGQVGRQFSSPGWGGRRVHLGHCHMPVGCDKDEVAGTRGFQGEQKYYECGISGVDWDRSSDMAGRGAKRIVQRFGTDNTRLLAHLGCLVHGLREI